MQKGGILLKIPEGDLVERSLRFGLAWKVRATSLKIANDSQLVVNQVNKTFAAKCLTMAEYLKKVQELMRSFEKVELKQLLRKENDHVNILANIASSVHLTGKRTIPMEFL